MPGRDEPALVGEDHRLHAAAQAELRQHRADVGLDRGFLDRQDTGDLGVAASAGDQQEHVALALAEPPERAAARGVGRHLGEAGDQPARDVRVDEALAAGDGTDRVDEHLGFVVALGTDYNIFMTARLREEMLAGASPRQAIAEAVRHVAPAIAAAGLVLASAFGTLMLQADEGARQMGFAMALGILIASLVVSSVLVPAITMLLGRSAWWPGRASRAHRAVALLPPIEARLAPERVPSR